MRTLYVTDLDGTLLRPDQTLSDKTLAAFAALHDQGALVTYATARSITSASAVTKGLQTIAPVIVHNGVSIVEKDTHSVLDQVSFTGEEAADLAQYLKTHGIHALVYSRISGRERVSWLLGTENAGLTHYIDTRRKAGDPRLRPTKEEGALFEGEVYYITCIEADEALLTPLQNDILTHTPHQCILQRDVYDPEEFWCEVMPRTATKAHAMQKLAARLGADRTVVFGDALNDKPMFMAADECYAVQNACEELKALATGIIGSNSEDGVAAWLLANARV